MWLATYMDREMYDEDWSSTHVMSPGFDTRAVIVVLEFITVFYEVQLIWLINIL